MNEWMWMIWMYWIICSINNTASWEVVGWLTAEIWYPCAVVWYSSGRTLVPADSSGIPGRIYWTNMPDTRPVATTNRYQSDPICSLHKKKQSLDFFAFRTFPQARQWWRLQVSVNSHVQIIHMVVLKSGIQIGALEPSGRPSSEIPSNYTHRKKKTHEEVFSHKFETQKKPHTIKYLWAPSQGVWNQLLFYLEKRGKY